ncbi:IS982 family transposase [Ligilactobacillus acidipiscis]|uniref:Transposase DDE domain-containing protein n=1 Tax=Ligilactobacillus acidipiscis TaxID=89059 RepID=A0A1K1KPI6_9LACO|nr:IS982 family transposase [Ligilactobacillus acidipiscis]SFV40771.1 hypothetical protein LAC1533_1351 [Ligilactobacillus acidipiscis]
MLDHLKFKQKRHNLQVNLAQLKVLCAELYQKYCPRYISQRRNTTNSRVSDVQILALLCLQVITQMHSQRKFFAWAQTFIPHQLNIERSRFNRRAQRLLPVVMAMRQGLTRDYAQTGQFAIIDSLPNPLCQKVRNKRAKVFRGIADLGYNATKDMYFYGFKTHFETSLSGYILNYTVTEASKHDTQAASTLIAGCPCPFVLADVGYVGQPLQEDFGELGYELWTPYRSNMKGAKQHNVPALKDLRRTIESRFSILVENYGIEKNLTRSVVGFWLKIELTVFIYNLGFFDFTENRIITN